MTLMALGLVLAPLATPAAAATPTFVDVIQVRGLLDPILVQFVDQAIDRARTDGAQALVIQLDSRGSLVSEARLAELTARIRSERDVPIAVWVDIGDHATGAAARLVAAAPIAGAAPRSHVDANRPMVVADYLSDFVGRLDGRRVHGHTIHTTVRHAGKLAVSPPHFAKPALFARLLHATASPSVAYLLLIAGGLLLLFEFFTAGIGIAAGVGAASLALASYGLGVLPTRPIGLVLLAVAMFGFAVDIQAGAPRLWTMIGTVTLVLGSLLLFDDRRVPLFTLVVIVALTVLAVVSGMPSMVRTRFATPTIGRESMIGELGRAAVAVAPEGIVVVRGAQWRARANRATPIPAGDDVRVIAIDGLLLEVEPLEGAAKDAGH